MSIILYIVILFLDIPSFALSVCNDRVVTLHNMYQEFIIDNVDGVGKLSVPIEFKKLTKLHVSSHKTTGDIIYDRFKRYTRSRLRFLQNLIPYVITLMDCYEQPGELICFDRLMFVNELSMF